MADPEAMDRPPRQDALTVACLASLSRWNAPTPSQEGLRIDYLVHLRTRESGWSRECTGEHLTASGLICRPDGAVLLTLHARLGRWLQTGGHLEAADESLEAAALREATEESGLVGLTLDPTPLTLSRHQVACGPTQPTFHLDVQYLALSADARPPRRSDESSDLRWFAPDALPDVDDSVLELVAAAGRRLSA